MMMKLEEVGNQMLRSNDNIQFVFLLELGSFLFICGEFGPSAKPLTNFHFCWSSMYSCKMIFSVIT